MISKTEWIIVIDASGVVVWASAPPGAPSFIGQPAPAEWVQQVKEAGASVFSSGYEGLDGQYRVAIAVQVVNRDTCEYVGIFALSAVTTNLFQFCGNLENID